MSRAPYIAQAAQIAGQEFAHRLIAVVSPLCNDTITRRKKRPYVLEDLQAQWLLNLTTLHEAA